MKRIFPLLALFLVLPMTAQVTLSKNRLIKDGQSYKFKEYKEVFTNDEARNYFKKARRNKNAATILAYSGGFFLGFGVAGAIVTPKTYSSTLRVPSSYNPYPGQPPSYSDYVITGKNNKSGYWITAGIGAALVGVAIPLASTANKNAKKALAAENVEATAFKPYFKIQSAGNGVALSYNF